MPRMSRASSSSQVSMVATNASKNDAVDVCGGGVQDVILQGV